MTRPWSEEIVWVEMPDGVTHDGAVFRPAGEAKPLAVVWVHGLTGRFSEKHQVTIGRHLASNGYTFVTGNNRGHHHGTGIRRRGADAPDLGGGFWELVSESWIDVKGWLDYAQSLGFERLVLAGHSLGALKVVWYAGDHPDARLAGLISASGPVRIHSRRSPEVETLVRRMLAEGRDLELLPFGTLPPIGTASARTVADRALKMPEVYGLDGKPDFPLARVTCPFLALLGTDEPNIATPADLTQIQSNARKAARSDTAMIQGADHVYTGQEQQAAEIVLSWVQELG